MIPKFLATFLSYAIGIVYPAYKSCKALKARQKCNVEKWLKYWVSYATYCFVLWFTDVFVGFWCPFYYEIVILFNLWLLPSVSRGGDSIFKIYLCPLIKKYEKQIDSGFAKFWKAALRVLMSMNCFIGLTLLKCVPKLIGNVFLKSCDDESSDIVSVPDKEKKRRGMRTRRSYSLYSDDEAELPGEIR